MSEPRDIERLLAIDIVDAGCAAGFAVLHLYVESELAGHDPARDFSGLAAHLRTCSGCREDYLGLLEAAQRFGSVEPPPA